MHTLDEPYRGRAAPLGSARYWSWLFAHPQSRGPLLGVYALLAEWLALMHPGTERPVAETKILWWREEMQRLARRTPIHPIARYLAALPNAPTIDFEPLLRAAQAAAVHIGGVPIERGGELNAHANALLGGPLLVAAQFAAPQPDADGLRDCTRALAIGDYLARATADYRSAALAGRMLFPVDELLAAGIGNDDLAMRAPPPRLRTYLAQARQRAADQYAFAAQALRPEECAAQRGLLVLAALGSHHLRRERSPSVHGARLQDILVAWRAARRAVRAR